MTQRNPEFDRLQLLKSSAEAARNRYASSAQTAGTFAKVGFAWAGVSVAASFVERAILSPGQAVPEPIFSPEGLLILAQAIGFPFAAIGGIASVVVRSSQLEKKKVEEGTISNLAQQLALTQEYML